jgi:cytochrome b pre-mRNA-processing protein 3
MFTRLKERAALRRTSRNVYGSIVTQARIETFYRDWRVPDTMEGRLEMIILHVGLMLDRLALEGAGGLALGQAVSEAYIADVDDALRQIGTGDMGVPRRVKKAAAALRERRKAYAGALQANDRGALVDAVRGFVFVESQDDAASASASRAICDYMLQVAETLGALPSEGVLAGNVTFPDPSGSGQG